MGRSLAALREDERPLVFTKVGVDLVDPETHEELPPPTPVDVLKRSPRRLGVERVDLYQVHWAPKRALVPLEEYWQTMLDLRREGQVRAIGLSNHDVAQLEAAASVAGTGALVIAEEQQHSGSWGATVTSGEHHGLHGRISSIPARQVSWKVDVNGAWPVVEVRGTVRETSVFGADLELTRTLSFPVGSPRVEVHDMSRTAASRRPS